MGSAAPSKPASVHSPIKEKSEKQIAREIERGLKLQHKEIMKVFKVALALQWSAVSQITDCIESADFSRVLGLLKLEIFES